MVEEIDISRSEREEGLDEGREGGKTWESSRWTRGERLVQRRQWRSGVVGHTATE